VDKPNDSPPTTDRSLDETSRGLDAAKRWRRRFFLLATAWLAVTFLCSFREVRGVLIRPLYVHDAGASGELAYVMADGAAYWERLRAASDLYHMRRVKQIYILEENQPGGFNFTLGRLQTWSERAVDYLELYGVPRSAVHLVPRAEGAWLGSRSEAVGLARQLESCSKLVVVTSPPHTRRSELCFDRVFPEEIVIDIFSAKPPHESAETNDPIWIEYFKLVVYWFLA
jgi:hypothetical protein